jgi:anti-sigma factor RsiW
VSHHPTAEQLSRLIDADLPLTERAAVLDHLATCPLCAASHARLVEAAAALRELPAVAWRPELAAGIAVRAAEPRRAPTRRRRTPFGVAAIAAVAVALVLAVIAALPVALLGARVVAACVGAVAPLGAGSPGRLLLTLVGTVLVAPVLIYPLARWR